MKEKIKKLIKNKEKIFKKLKKRKLGVDSYFLIKQNYKKRRIQNDLRFQSEYKNFYRMNRPGFTAKFFREYFKLLDSKEKSLKNILLKLYETPTKKGKKKVWFSFSTKLLHTVNNNLPIYDKFIGKFFKLELIGGSKDEKIDSRVENYNKLKKYFKQLLNDKAIQNFILDFRKKFSCDRKKISDTKVLDFIIWANGQLDS